MSVWAKLREFCDAFGEVKGMALHNLSNSDLELDEIMDKADAILGGYGVEALASEYAWDSYFGSSMALYVNMGDTYAQTFIYMVEDTEFIAASWGDALEEFEAGRGE